MPERRDGLAQHPERPALPLLHQVSNHVLDEIGAERPLEQPMQKRDHAGSSPTSSPLAM